MRTLLAIDDIQRRLADLSGWTLHGITIKKEFAFKNFLEAVAFVNRIAECAERLDHHPDLFINSYRKVEATLSTHSAEGVTAMDFALAKEIDGVEKG